MNSAPIHPLLSIVMPVFNHPGELRLMVDSILANTFNDWELLLVDDGSEQPTIELIEAYAQADERVHFIRRDRMPKGAQSCRNIGLELSRGEFIIFLDADDYLTPTALETRVKAILNTDDLDFMTFPSGTFDNNGFHAAPQRYAFGYKIYADDLRAFAARTLPFIVWNNIYHRKALITNALKWDENLLSLQDADFNVQALLAGLRYAYAPVQPHFGYRILQNQSVSKGIRSEAHRQSHLYAVNKFYEQIQRYHGHRYDHALYQGVLHLYNSIFSEHFDPGFAQQLTSIVQRRSRHYGTLLSIQVQLTKWLSFILPQKRARQLPMILYLVSQAYIRWRNRRRIQQLFHSFT